MPAWGVPQPDASADSDRSGFADANLHGSAGRHANNRAVVHANEHHNADPNAHGCAKRHARSHRGAPADRIARPFPDARLIANSAACVHRNSGCPIDRSRRRFGGAAN